MLSFKRAATVCGVGAVALAMKFSFPREQDPTIVINPPDQKIELGAVRINAGRETVQYKKGEAFSAKGENETYATFKQLLSEANLLSKEAKIKIDFTLPEHPLMKLRNYEVDRQYIIVGLGEKRSEFVKRIQKKCPDGCKLNPDCIPKEFKAGRLVYIQLLFSDKNFNNREGLSPKTASNIVGIFKASTGFSNSLYDLIYSDNFRSASADRQEALTGFVLKALQKSTKEFSDEYLYRDLISTLKLVFDEKQRFLFESGKEHPSIIESFSNFLDKPVIIGTHIEFLDTIMHVLVKNNGGVDQGKTGTCSVSALMNVLASRYPREFTAFCCSIFNDHYFRSKQGYTIYAFPQKDLPKEAAFNLETNLFNIMIQSTLMEALNGDKIWNPSKDRFTFLREPVGGGRGLDEIAWLMENIVGSGNFSTMRMEYGSNPQYKNAPIEILNSLLEQGPVIVSLKWRKLTEKEIQKSLAEKGGSRTSIATRDGYSTHALAVDRVDFERGVVICFTSWGQADHKQYNETNPFVYANPVGKRYIEISFDDFLKSFNGLIANTEAIEAEYKKMKDHALWDGVGKGVFNGVMSCLALLLVSQYIRLNRVKPSPNKI